MVDVPLQIAREAKALQQGLKEFLRTRDILDREIDIQRKNLRRQYLRLILIHPYAKESKDAETHLWMQTSYAIISIYKQRLSALDRATQNPSRQNQSHPPVVEHRKLLQRFRQFLADEEKFWTQLVLRLRRNFAVDDAQPALVALGIAQDLEPPVPQQDSTNPNRRNQFQFPPESDLPNPAVLPSSPAQRDSRLAIVCKALICLGDIARYKELYNEAGGRPRAGHEDGPSAILSVKAARGKRSSAHAAHPSFPRARDYSVATKCYEQARLLIPNDGNPSHQLAIISSYKKQVFESLFHYYRALCVRQPYDTASENLGSTLQKALHQWKISGAKRDKEREQARASGAEPPPRPVYRVAEFKEKLAVVHAQWRFGEPDPDNLADKLAEEYKSLVEGLVIPEDIISRVIIISQGALWKHRMIRQPSERRTMRSPAAVESRIVSHVLALHRGLLSIGSKQLREPPEEDAREPAQRITATFRRTLQALRMAGKWVRGNLRYLSQARRPGEPLPIPPPQPAEDPNASNENKPAKGKGREGRRSDKPRTPHSVEIRGLPSFWVEYVMFVNALKDAFPFEVLPALVTPLEEDVEVAGFLPLRKFMVGDVKPGVSRPDSPKENGTKENGTKAKRQNEGPVSRDLVHPNDEYLMRISDMLVDAKAVAEDEGSPVVLVNDKFEYTGPLEDVVLGPEETMDTDAEEANEVAMEIIPSEEEEPDVNESFEDDAMTESGHTEDEIVNDAFKHLDRLEDEEEDGDEEDEIVWNPRMNLSTHDLSIAPVDPVTPQRASPVSPKVSDYTPPRVAPPPQPQFQALEAKKTSPVTMTRTIPTATTAQDLLNNVMGVPRVPAAAPYIPHHTRGSSSPGAATPFLLFGSGGPTQSIWSPALDGNSLNYTSVTRSPPHALNGGALHNSPPAPSHRSPPSLNQIPWADAISPPLSQQSQAAQFLGSLGPSFVSPAQQTKFTTGHQRGISESLATARKFYPPSPPLHNTLIQQSPPIRRVDAWPPPQDHQQVGLGFNNVVSPPQTQTQPTLSMGPLSETIYSATPNPAFCPSLPHRQHSQSQPLPHPRSQPQPQQQQTRNQFNNIGFASSSIKSLRPSQGFAAAPFMQSSSSIWGSPG